MAVLDALDGVERICGTGRTAVTGVCAGGIIASVMAVHLAAAGQQDLVDSEVLDSEVLPVINGYWERTEFPWPLIKKLGKLRIVGDGIDRYGCPPLSPIAAGL
jgi:hypothetical protein